MSVTGKCDCLTLQVAPCYLKKKTFFKPYDICTFSWQGGRVVESIDSRKFLGSNPGSAVFTTYSWASYLCLSASVSKKVTVIVPPWSGCAEDEMRKKYTKRF